MMPNLDCPVKSVALPQLPLALSSRMHYIRHITRAVPLVRKVNAHQGRVFLFPGNMPFEGAA
jgi:hypothetical protein